MLSWLKSWWQGKPLMGRASQWPAARRIHLAREPTCAVCGTRQKVEVHHVLPYHLFPELELDPDNLITLCEGSGNHHLWFGHLGWWRAWNPSVREDAAVWHGKIRQRLAPLPPQ